MQLILLQNVQNLGKLGDKVNVKPGFGRNYLIPYGKAAPALAELSSGFRYNDAVLRHLIVARDCAETEQSLIMKSKDEKPERRRRDEDSDGDSAPAASAPIDDAAAA